MSSKGVSRKCTYQFPEGRQCKAWAVRESDPPRCVSHRQDDGPKVGAPEGNQNRLVHGWYAQGQQQVDPIVDIDAAVENLGVQLARSTMILGGTEDPDVFYRAFALHVQALSRQGRLLRDQRALSGEAADSLLGALGQAIDELGTEWGTTLLKDL